MPKIDELTTRPVYGIPDVQVVLDQIVRKLNEVIQRLNELLPED